MCSVRRETVCRFVNRYRTEVLSSNNNRFSSINPQLLFSSFFPVFLLPLSPTSYLVVLKSYLVRKHVSYEPYSGTTFLRMQDDVAYQNIFSLLMHFSYDIIIVLNVCKIKLEDFPFWDEKFDNDNVLCVMFYINVCYM